jgi:hypothetical protein
MNARLDQLHPQPFFRPRIGGHDSGSCAAIHHEIHLAFSMLRLRHDTNRGGEKQSRQAKQIAMPQNKPPETKRWITLQSFLPCGMDSAVEMLAAQRRAGQRS